MTQVAHSARGIFALTILSSFALACSGGGGGGASGADGVSKLSPEQQQAYQAWLKAPIKSCQAIEVVGGGSTTFSDGSDGGPSSPQTPGFPGGFPGFPSGSVNPDARVGQNAIEKGVDLKVLAERTGGSLWLSDAAKPDTFAMLSGGATGFTSGSATSKFEQTITIDGSAQSVKVETRSSGFDCVVKINDIEVATISIAKSVDVALAASSLSKFKDLEVPTREIWQTYASVTTVSTPTLSRAIDSTMRQDEAATSLVSKLGYSVADAKKYFVLRGSNVNGGFGIEFPTLGGRMALAGESEIVLDEDQMNLLPPTGISSVLSLVSIYRTGGVAIGGVRFNPGSNEVMVVRRQISGTVTSPNVVFHDLGVKSVSSMTATPEMADVCAEDRVNGYSSLYLTKLQSRALAELPGRRTIFGACESFEPEIQSRYNRSDLSLRALNKLMKGVSRGLIRDSGTRFGFGDWTSFVAAEIRGALDPKSSAKLALSIEAPILVELDGYIVAARLTPEFSQMAPVFVDPIAGVILALGENSRGAALENSLIRRSVQAAVKVGPIYLSPFARSLQYVRTTPSAAEDALSWIESTTPSLLQAGREALVEAQAIGYEKFQSDFEMFFISRPNERDLTMARDEMRNLRTQLAAYPALASVKRDVVQAIYKNPKFDSRDISVTLSAASKLVVASEELAREFLGLVKESADPVEIASARAWAGALTSVDSNLIRDFLSASLASGYGDDALRAVRAMVHSRPTTLDLQAFANAVALSKQFLADEAKRAMGSTSDTFYESEAKTLAKRIAIEGFTTVDLAALESMAQVAGSDSFCDRKTISYRLKCVGLDAFSKARGKMLSPEFQGRNARLADQIASWMRTLKPDIDHSSVRRTLKKALFDSDSGPWAKCNVGQFDLNSRALASAVQGYIQVMGDFSARFRAERAVSAAVDARCP
ncbi:hypothetical protein BH10BDE1_BH10BDE1_10560 [soil metagenome]